MEVLHRNSNKYPEVILIGEDGSNIGKVSLKAAFSQADSAGLDVIKVGFNGFAVCRLMDYGKVKYQQQKRKQPKPKKRKNITIRGNIGPKDLERKVNNVSKFVSSGHDVIVTLITARNQGNKKEVLDNIIGLLPVNGATSIQSINAGKRIIKLQGD